MDWSNLFALEVPALELFLRGTLMYWFLFLTFRFVLRRDAGSLGLADILLLVIIADAAQNGMAGAYQTVTEGIVLVTTIIGWNVLLDRLAYAFPIVARFAEPPPLLLVNHGRILRANLRKEYLTKDELMSQLRIQGVDSLEQVKSARLESDGSISVIREASREKNAKSGKS